MDHLIACAADLFLTNGYHKVSLDRIAREARVAVRTIYLKFGGKAGLFGAVVRTHRAELFAAMPHIMEPGERELSDVLVSFAQHYLALVTSERSLALLRLVIAEAPRAPDVCLSFMHSGPETIVALLTDFFSHPQVLCQLRSDLSPEHLARHLISCLLGDHLSRLLSYPTPGREAGLTPDIHTALTLFLKGARRYLP